jgi:molybdate transport system ATP-binding protein
VRDKAKRDHVVAEKLRQFQLEAVAGQKPWQLSGGQQQRTALARIFASEPKAILLDEPFSALDSYLKYQLEVELAETLERFPGPVLWVSHDRGEVFRNCCRVCVIDRGHSQPVQTLAELFRRPDTEAAARLSGCKNYAKAVPQGDSILLPEWNVTLRCAGPVAPEVCRMGIRAHHVRFAAPGGENAFSCAVTRVIEDVFSTVVLLRPDGAEAGAPPLRMELEKAAWQAAPDKTRVTVEIPGEDILLLRS